MNQTSPDSTVRVLSLSRFCSDFPENVCLLSGFCPEPYLKKTVTVFKKTRRLNPADNLKTDGHDLDGNKEHLPF